MHCLLVAADEYVCCVWKLSSALLFDVWSIHRMDEQQHLLQTHRLSNQSASSLTVPDNMNTHAHTCTFKNEAALLTRFTYNIQIEIMIMNKQQRSTWLKRGNWTNACTHFWLDFWLRGNLQMDKIIAHLLLDGVASFSEIQYLTKSSTV